MEEKKLKEASELFASRFNKMGELFKLHAFVTDRNYITIQGGNWETVATLRVTGLLPDECEPLKFKDTEGNEISVYECATGHNIDKRVGEKCYGLEYNASSRSFEFTLNDPDSEYPSRQVEYSADGLSISFSQESKTGKSITISSTNNHVLRVAMRKEVGEPETGFLISYGVHTFKEVNGKSNKDFKTYIDNIDASKSAEFVGIAFKQPVVNGLIWNSLAEMDCAFPGMLEFLKANTDIETRLAGEYQPQALVDHIVEESEIGNFEFSKGTRLAMQFLETK